MTTVGRKPILAACLALAMSTAQCRSDGSEDLLALAPGLPPEVASHLVNDSPEQFRDFARRTEFWVLRQANFELRTAPPSASESEFLRVERLLAPYCWRMAEALASTHANRSALSVFEFYQRYSLPERIEITNFLRESSVYYFQNFDSDQARATALADLLRRASVYSKALNLADLYGIYAALLQQLDRSEEEARYLELGVQDAVFHGDIGMACQLLGMLGTHYQTRDPVAMRRAYDRALEYARQSNSWQEARILSFYASYYRDRGQLAIARDLLIEAQDRCRARGANEAELRFLLDTMDFLAQLHCWEAVGRGLERAVKLADPLHPKMIHADVQLELARLQGLRALHAAATGDCDRARTLALEVAARTGAWSLGPHRTTRIQCYAAQALSKCGSHAESRVLLERGLQASREFMWPEIIDDTSIELASTVAALDSVDLCERILAASDFEPGSKHVVRAATLRLKMALSRNDRASAFVHLRQALHGLDAMERGLGASPEAYLAVSANDELRRLAHAYLDPVSVAAGYAFEMRWRTALTRRVGFGDVPASGATFVARLEAEAQRAAERLREREAVHCVFDVREATTVRTVASSTGFAKDEIAISAAELSSWVQQASHFASSPSASEAGDWSGAARTLAELLLPDPVSKARLLLTTANGCLTRLQFETLNRSDSGYVPLIQQMDVATLRFWNPEPFTRGDSCLVVVEPTFAASLRRRHADLEEPIPHSRAEADHARRQLFGSILLTGSSATKRQVVPRWERARVLYFAGHMLQDAELGYLTFIPMGQPPVGQEDDSYLEVADVRNADLSHCELVVLSSCASGAPYAHGEVVAPSMAEVFLDAGARAAVSTAWPVRDEAAARLMTQFIQYYAQSGEADPIRSLCDAQRMLAVESSDPSIWANYSIHVTRLEPPTESFGHANAGERRAR